MDPPIVKGRGLDQAGIGGCAPGHHHQVECRCKRGKVSPNGIGIEMTGEGRVTQTSCSGSGGNRNYPLLLSSEPRSGNFADH
jgi:hypothetical protein